MVRKSGGAGKPARFDRTLYLDIEALRKGNNYTTVEELVSRLRSTYPQYSRQKLQPLTKRVTRITDILSRENNDVVTPLKRKQGKFDAGEERLQLIEEQHVKRRKRDISNNSSASSSSLASAASSGSTSDADEAFDEDNYISDDAVYGEEVKPEFDLMKAMLRANYTRNLKELAAGRDTQEGVELEIVDNENDKKELAAGRDTQEGVELEIVDNKNDKKVNLMNEGQHGHAGGADAVQNTKYDNSTGEDNDKCGPTFEDLGGMSGVINELMMEVIVPFYHPYLPCKLGVKPITGILFHGPPGCGKTKLAHAIANETKVPFYKICATEMVSGVSGASEENIRELFSKAYRTSPSIVFIDEIDSIASKREGLQREMERRIVTQLMACMDESHRPKESEGDNKKSESSDSKPGYVLVIGATNRPDALDPALRRPGRFDREFLLAIPDERARVEILKVLTRKLTIEGDFDLAKIARSTPGFVGADLLAVANKAGNLAMKRIIEERRVKLSAEVLLEVSYKELLKPWSQEEIDKLSISMADFEEAVKFVQPSSRREGFSTVPDVNWEDVGGLHLLRHQLNRDIIERIKDPEDYEKLGINSGAGVLLHGPPGCGKTLIAKAVASEAGASFIHIKGPELLNKYVGESELAIRKIFSRARTCSPCILFFDEVDALTTQRGRGGVSIGDSLVTQLLSELSGKDNRGVFIIGATNRIDVMDPALLRPERFGTRVYVPLPSPRERGMILKALGRNKPIDTDVDLMAIGEDDACENFSGADLSALMEAASIVVLEEKKSSLEQSPGKRWTIKEAHLKLALQTISPSVSQKEREKYEFLAKKFK